VKKVRGSSAPSADGFEEAIRLARRFQGETDAPTDSEIVWADPQTHSPATITDAVMKQYLGRLIDRSTALSQLGLQPDEDPADPRSRRRCSPLRTSSRRRKRRLRNQT
jgi:hypothetical protein